MAVAARGEPLHADVVAAQHVVNLDEQISWQAQPSVNLEVQILWQKRRRFLNLDAKIPAALDEPLHAECVGGAGIANLKVHIACRAKHF